MNKLKFTFLYLLLLGSFSSIYAQTASVSPSTICEGALTTIMVQYTPPSGKTISNYEFDLFNNGANVVTTPANQAQYTYPYTPGTYTAKVRVKHTDGSYSANSPTVTITVYYSPVVNFSIITQDTQCFRGNSFCFKNLATQNPKSPSNPLSSYYWNYGDASGDTMYTTGDICHTYVTPITVTTGFSVLLSVTDNKGCRKDTIIGGYVTLKPNIAPAFKWTFISGPCFISCYHYQNLSQPKASEIMTYKWDFGEDTSNNYTSSGLTDPYNYDSITHCYRRDGQFKPGLVLTDMTGCTDSTRYTPFTTTKPLPQNINFTFDMVTTKSAIDTATRKDSVCSGSGNVKNICFRMTPISFAQAGSGDFVWNFGDPNDPQKKNKDSSQWNPCHLYSGMGTFFPRITIKHVCPDTTFFYHSAISTYSKLDSAFFPDNDWGPNPTPPPGAQTLPYVFPAPIDILDSITLYYTGTVRYLSQLSEAPTLDTAVYAFTTASRDRIIYFRKLNPIINVIGIDTFIKSTVKIPINYILDFNKIPGAKALYHKYSPITGKYDSVYAYKTSFERPVYYFKKSALITDTLPSNLVQNNVSMYYNLLNSFKVSSYGVEVLGPSAGIENPNIPVVIKGSQKNQCGPTDTVDFVNTSAYFKSRKIWRRWDFDDNFAPQCTSFSVPRRGFPSGAWGQGPWTTAIAQDYGSDHYFIANGVTYPGRMSCKFSFDTLPRYSYPNWDTVYNWYRKGHDFMPWDYARWDTINPPGPGKFFVQPNDKNWWGKPIYLNIGTGAWSLDPGTTVMHHKIYSYLYTDPISGLTSTRYWVDTIATSAVPNTVVMQWPRIDTMRLRTNNGQDLNPGSPLLVQNIPDPIGLARGKYVILNGPQIDTVGPALLVKSGGDQWVITPKTIIPGGGDFYEYVFRRTIQRCLTVKQRLKDSSNNETSVPGGQYDSLVLDNNDCFDEATVQLALGKADARGLAIGGKHCPGNVANAFGANVKFSFSQLGVYPGLVPACGQTYVQFNYDSLADRKDQTPCVIDGFVGFGGGVTGGGIFRPPFFSQADFNPLSVWTSPGGTTFIYHFESTIGFATPPPADTANGWVTVGIQIGNGCDNKSLTNVLMSQFRNNQAVYTGSHPTYPSYTYNRIYNFRPLTPGIPDTLVDVEYIDCNVPRCVSTPIWYHNFIRIINLQAAFEIFPQQAPTSVWKLRGKGDLVTVFYADSVQDSVKYDSWQWGDATVTVDSFWYAGDDTTNNGFFVNGMRRVRYNIDQFDPGRPIIMDSTVFPIRASGPFATDGLKPRTPGAFKYVSYDTIDYCTGLPKANPSFIVVDTAMMLLPVSHRYIRSSWEADNRIDPYKGPDANISAMVHFMSSTAGCQRLSARLITIGIIDTFETRSKDGNGKLVFDTTFCVKETVYFHDSVRYWRYDCHISNLTDPDPAQTRNPAMGNPPYSPVTLANPYDLMQIDTFDFWRFNEFYPLDFTGRYYDDQIVKYNLSTSQFDTIKRHDSIFTERIYWDYGDGNTDQGKNPHHAYEGYGRYKVSMFTRDSMGFWDTCVRYVNIVRPVARIGLTQDLFNCGVPAVPMWDSSYIVFGTGPTSTDKVLTQYWWFGDNKADTINPFTPATNNPKPEYPYRSNGKFKIKLVVVTDQGCMDTTTRDIFIKGPRPAFRLITDTVGCSPFKVKLVNMADSLDMQGAADTPTRKTIIYWGDGGQTFLWGRRDTAEHIYPDSGTFVLSAYGTDEDPVTGLTTCLPVYFPDTVNGANKPIKIYLVKFPVAMEVSAHHICPHELFHIDNTSDSNYTSFKYYMYQGTTLVDSVDQTTHIPPSKVFYNKLVNAGPYQIYGFPNGYTSKIPPGTRKNCVTVDTMNVEVHKTKALFQIDSTVGSSIFKMSNLTVAGTASKYQWDMFNADGTLRESKQGVEPGDRDWTVDLKDDTGSYKVCLIARLSDTLGFEGCPDSVCHILTNSFLTRIKWYNVFSPNGDNFNDFFKIDIEGEIKFNLTIFNRWGDKVFESNDSKKMWNGTNMNDGSTCSDGVYYFVLTYQFRGKDKPEAPIHSSVTLIK